LVACALATALATALALSGCQASDQASGASFSAKTTVQLSTFDQAAATGENGALVDSSHAANGYVGVSATAGSRLKAQVINGQETTNYDLAQDGTATILPLTAGSGTYTVRVMQNTSGNNYVELYSTSFEAAIASETEPFLYPNVNCNYTSSSACVSKARELVSSATNQGEAVKAICNWIVENISYDDDKASQLKDATGYVPDPDSTLSTGSGICFDYASLGAAMLRSQGIPTKIVTGYVSPNSIYHAWIMVYIDGTWTSAQFSVSQNTWSRVDLTFAASSDGTNTGDGKTYTDRFVY
jgi:transglutaminase-like putative cysteine protease